MTDMGVLPAPTVTMVCMRELMQGDEAEGDGVMMCCEGHRMCISKWYRMHFGEYLCPECQQVVAFPDKQLFDAAFVNDFEVMRPLLESGECWIDRAFEPEGRTALHNAARNGHIEAVQLLIDAKCYLEPKASEYTPLINAAFHGKAGKRAAGHRYEEVVEALLKAGADVNAVADVRTAEQWAEFYHNDSITEVFEKHAQSVADQIPDQNYPISQNPPANDDDFTSHENPISEE